eukprot:SAG11_NODE_689_length_7713_cov_3.470055_3_plen_209_part_00
MSRGTPRPLDGAGSSTPSTAPQTSCAARTSGLRSSGSAGGGAPIIGVINQPASGDRWVGCRGTATLHNGAPARCAPCASLDTARLSASGSGFGALVDEDWVQCAHALVQGARTASFGGPNAYGWGLLASGCVDVLLDASDSEIYDIAAAIPVVEGAGGRVLSYDGTALDRGTVLPLAVTGVPRTLVRRDDDPCTRPPTTSGWLRKLTD